MSTYQVKVVDITVHRWDDEHGQGDYVCSKGGFEIGVYDTIANALKAIEEWFGYPLERDNFDTNWINVSQIEDVDAYATPDGDYIADYTLIVNKVDMADFTNCEDYL